MTELREDVWRTCIHEAGHAVLCTVLGITVHSVSRLDRAVESDWSDSSVENMMVALGGCVAESILLGVRIEPEGPDADDLIGERSRWVEEIRQLVEKVLRVHWSKVVELAVELLGEDGAADS